MCGRYTHLYKWKQLHRLMTLTSPPVDLPLRYNVAPTQSAPVVRADAKGNRTVAMLHWGLVPSWAKDAKVGHSLINARDDGVATRPAFRSAFARRRCLVPVSGFYEWKQAQGRTTKQPYYITAADGEPLAFAGLWELWSSPAGEKVESYCIVTTGPNETMSPIHNRMPAIINPPDFTCWLDPASEPQALRGLLRPCAPGFLTLWPVSRHVNSPRHDDPVCVQRFDPPEVEGLF